MQQKPLGPGYRWGWLQPPPCSLGEDSPFTTLHHHSPICRRWCPGCLPTARHASLALEALSSRGLTTGVYITVFSNQCFILTSGTKYLKTKQFPCIFISPTDFLSPNGSLSRPTSFRYHNQLVFSRQLSPLLGEKANAFLYSYRSPLPAPEAGPYVAEPVSYWLGLRARVVRALRLGVGQKEILLTFAGNILLLLGSFQTTNTDQGFN